MSATSAILDAAGADDSAGATVLIVDDQPQNLRLVSDYLARHGFELMLTRSGEQALEKVRLATPDLILLDLRMPGMDGFEVCRRLKGEESTAGIPVIFMTAEDETEQKIAGFALGAADYITKPVQREELLARIQHHLQLYRLQRMLRNRSEALAAKNAELEAYAHTIAHSLKTPLAASARFLEILRKYKSDNLSAEQSHLLTQAATLLANTGGAIDALLMLSTVANEDAPLEALDMDQVLARVLQQVEDQRAAAEALIGLPPSWPAALGFAPWVAEVWLNLVTNAVKYSGTPPRLTLGGARDGAQVRFWVRDNGVPLSEEQCRRVFTPFTRLQRERSLGHGLGLVTAQRIVARLGGELRARALPEGGNEFSFTLPPLERP